MPDVPIFSLFVVGGIQKYLSGKWLMPVWTLVDRLGIFLNFKRKQKIKAKTANDKSRL